MFSASDYSTIYDFVKSTGEGNVRKMMTGTTMTPVHIGLLLKLVRGCTTQDFSKCGEGASFPNLKFSPQEREIKDTFWKTTCEACAKLGLVSAQNAA